MHLFKRIINKIEYERKKYRLRNKPKLFCIGANKTGTTSLKKAFQDLGFIVGNQRTAEKLLVAYKAQNFQPIIEYCKTAQVFQDFPFSFPETYKYLDKAYPNAKFILTLRDSPEQWYNSYINHQTKLFGKNGNLPTKKDLQNATYVWKGWMWDIKNAVHKRPGNDIYNKPYLIEQYKTHIANVKEYFKNRPDDLIVLNVAQEGSYADLMQFLNINSPYDQFPWENRTQN